MNLNYSIEEEQFRIQVQQFLKDNLPQSLAQKVASGTTLSKADCEQWHAILHKQGWLASHWPAEFGGPNWSAVQKNIFEVECCLANAPRIVPFGVNMLGPVLIKYGTKAQQQYWLPRILDGSDWWCQGYSEPGSGSDLASVKTSAIRDGDVYIVNGQKTWTTLGQHANMIFCLVRTNRDVKQQQGISFLLIDMKSEGVEVRPIRTIEGGHEVNEIFFTDVNVPVENLVGEENQGWTCAKYLLTYERTNIAGVGFSMVGLQRLKTLAKHVQKNGKPLLHDSDFAARLARVEIDLENMKTTNLRVIAAASETGVPGAESSMLKIRGTQIRQEIYSLMRRALGNSARAHFDVDEIGMIENAFMDEELKMNRHATADYFNNRKLSIFGGSNEIQKNIISKMILGL